MTFDTFSDFLDSETARINAMNPARRQLVIRAILESHVFDRDTAMGVQKMVHMFPEPTACRSPETEDCYASIATRILTRVEEKDLPAEELAKMAGVHPMTLHNTLSGRTKHPRIDFLVKMARLLDCSVEWLATGNDVMKQ